MRQGLVQENVFMVTELLQCDLHDALGEEALSDQLAWRRRGRQIALDIAKGLSCARHPSTACAAVKWRVCSHSPGLGWPQTPRPQTSRPQPSQMPAQPGSRTEAMPWWLAPMVQVAPELQCTWRGPSAVCAHVARPDDARWPADLHDVQHAVHFDLKSPNILLASDFKAKIAGAPDL